MTAAGRVCVESTFDEVPTREVGAAAWLVDARLSGRVMLVGSFLPPGFEAYARILHPARVGDRSATWAQIAAWAGRELRADSDSADLMVRADGTGWEDVDGHQRPSEGTGGLEDGYRRLDALLGEATATPDRIWGLFDVIEYPMPSSPSGYQPASRLGGEWVADRREERRQLQRMEELKAAAGVDVAGGNYILHRGLIGPDRDGLDALPSYWWPDDRAWLVHTNVDCPTTYVASSSELVERLIGDDLLEVVEAKLDDPFDGHRR
jgi:hypothetical protein